MATVVNATLTPNTSETDHEILMAVIGILSFFSVIGTVGNALVLYVYVRKRNKLASTVFIITLACTDFVTCVLIIPYTMVLEYMEYFIKYDFLCKSYMFLITSNVPFSAFIMMSIAVDRYLCICHPFSHVLNTKRAKLVISLLAFIAFMLGTITALNFGVYYRNSLGNKTIHEVKNEQLKYNQPNISTIKIVPVEFANSSYYMQSYDRFNITTFSQTVYVEQTGDIETSSIVEYNGKCLPNGMIFNKSFTDIYQKVYSSFFVIVIVVVMVLYVMIYRFVTLRRARRQRMRSQRSGYSSCKEQTTMTVMPFAARTRVSLTQGCANTEIEPDSTCNINGTDSPKTEKIEIARQMTIREKGLVANIRTAAMLFVVTAVFIIVFLPAWLMAHKVIPYNMLIFYMYFFYNVANPIIYAFMNKSFRRALKEVIECRMAYM